MKIQDDNPNAATASWCRPHMRGHAASYRSSAAMPVLCIAAFVFAAIAFFCGDVQAKYSGGSGTEEDPYRLANQIDLYTLADDINDYNKCFFMIDDIDLDPNLPARRSLTTALIAPAIPSQLDFIPASFAGSFDGNGHTISNLTIGTNDANNGFLALFGSIAAGGRISNLTLTDAFISGGPDSAYLAALAARNTGGPISNCHAAVTVAGGTYLAGLVAYNISGAIDQCSAFADISGREFIGGLVAANTSGTVTDSSASGSVRGTPASWFVGGLIGSCDGGTISGCFSTADVNAQAGSNCIGGLIGDQRDSVISGCQAVGSVSSPDCWWLGGLAGRSYACTITTCCSTSLVEAPAYSHHIGGLIGRSGSDTITDSYARTDVAADPQSAFAGGLAGFADDCLITNCYASGAVPDANDAGGLLGSDYQNMSAISDCFFLRPADGGGPDNGYGLPLSDAQMKQRASFSNWDFRGPSDGLNDIWAITENLTYPRLSSQTNISVALGLSSTWMYQNLPGKTLSKLTATLMSYDDPMGNGSYTISWSFELPADVSVEPVTVSGGGAGDNFRTFAAWPCDEPAGISDSGQAVKVVCEIVGDDYGNSGRAEAHFGIALLGDANNDGKVNIVDRAIVNGFWRTGAAGTFSLKDCDMNCDGIVNIIDRSVTNAVFRGSLGQTEVSAPCPFR